MGTVRLPTKNKSKSIMEFENEKKNEEQTAQEQQNTTNHEGGQPASG